VACCRPPPRCLDEFLPPEEEEETKKKWWKKGNVGGGGRGSQKRGLEPPMLMLQGPPVLHLTQGQGAPTPAEGDMEQRQVRGPARPEVLRSWREEGESSTEVAVMGPREVSTMPPLDLAGVGGGGHGPDCGRCG
jgi:hypothetical protein